MYAIHRSAVKSEVIQAKSEIIQEYDKKLIEETEKNIKKERQLVSDHLRQTQEKNAKIQAINSKLNNAIAELRQRTTRPESNSENTSSTPEIREYCTGTQLYREDAEFLTREAARADKILAERDYCYNQYERARELLSN